jgi:aminopeptidase N
MRRSIGYLTALLATSARLVAAVPAATAGGPVATPGAAGLGDRLAPGLGNGGYDVSSYDLDLRYATSDPAQPIDGDETIAARATQSLSQFNLDFAGASVGGVAVDGKPAAFDRVERAWVDRYRGASASTDDFIALASQVSGRDVTDFLRSWLYGDTTPPMPGHPDWTVDPVVLTAKVAAGAPVQRRH